MTQNQIRYAELKEAQRTNRVNENIKQQSVDVSRASLEEEKRAHNLNYNASIYASGASYAGAAAAARQAEVAAINAATNQLNAQTNQGKAITEKAAQQETVRHNVEQEKLSRWQTVTNAVTNFIGTGINLATKFVLA